MQFPSPSVSIDSFLPAFPSAVDHAARGPAALPGAPTTEVAAFGSLFPELGLPSVAPLALAEAPAPAAVWPGAAEPVRSDGLAVPAPIPVGGRPLLAEPMPEPAAEEGAVEVAVLPATLRAVRVETERASLSAEDNAIEPSVARPASARMVPRQREGSGRSPRCAANESALPVIAPAPAVVVDGLVTAAPTPLPPDEPRARVESVDGARENVRSAPQPEAGSTSVRAAAQVALATPETRTTSTFASRPLPAPSSGETAPRAVAERPPETPLDRPEATPLPMRAAVLELESLAVPQTSLASRPESRRAAPVSVSVSVPDLAPGPVSAQVPARNPPAAGRGPVSRELADTSAPAGSGFSFPVDAPQVESALAPARAPDSGREAAWTAELQPSLARVAPPPARPWAPMAASTPVADAEPVALSSEGSPVAAIATLAPGPATPVAAPRLPRGFQWAGGTAAISAAGFRGRGERPAGGAAPGEKTFVSTGAESLTTNHPDLGTGVANSVAVMPVSLPPSVPQHPASEYAGVAPSVSAGIEPQDPVAAAAVDVSSAREAVEVVLRAVDQHASRETRSVDLHFSVGEAELRVRVELHADEVRTTFRTDSADLRSALAHEWQSVATPAPAGERSFRLAPATFAAGGDAGLQSSPGDTSSRERPAHAPHEAAPFFTGHGRPRAASGLVATAADTLRTLVATATSRHLHTLA